MKNKINKNLQKSVMRRVYAIWLLKRVTQPTAVKFYILLVLIWQLYSQVSVLSVIKNIPSYSFNGIVKFFINAMLSTEAVVQIIISFSFIVGILIARDLFKRSNNLKIA